MANLDIIGHVERSMAMVFEFIKFIARAITSDIEALWRYCRGLYEDSIEGKSALVFVVVGALLSLTIAFIFPRSFLVAVFIAWRLSRANEDDTDDE